MPQNDIYKDLKKEHIDDLWYEAAQFCYSSGEALIAFYLMASNIKHELERYIIEYES